MGWLLSILIVVALVFSQNFTYNDPEVTFTNPVLTVEQQAILSTMQSPIGTTEGK